MRVSYGFLFFCLKTSHVMCPHVLNHFIFDVVIRILPLSFMYPPVQLLEDSTGPSLLPLSLSHQAEQALVRPGNIQEKGIGGQLFHPLKRFPTGVHLQYEIPNLLHYKRTVLPTSIASKDNWNGLSSNWAILRLASTSSTTINHQL